jgi:fructose transport system substrate-binding protein
VGLLAVAALLPATGAMAQSPAASVAGTPIGVTLITKDPSNAFWTSMMAGANAAAAESGAVVTVASGRDQTDADSQIQAIENAISRGDKAILIAHNGPAVNDAIANARAAGILVIALDTPTDPMSLVDATFASDNYQAGQLIGQWTAAQLAGGPATIALLDLFGDKIVTIDYQRDQGFLSGMGIDLADPQRNGDEAPTGSYTGGQGGTYEIVCNGATNGAEDGGRSVMENCLSLNPDINVVFSANEPSGVGAVQALQAAGNTTALVTSIDGSCRGVEEVANGNFGAVSQQYPYQMGFQGVKAAVDYVTTGAKPPVTEGLDYWNTGISLVTDKPVEGIESIDTTKGTELCW